MVKSVEILQPPHKSRSIVDHILGVRETPIFGIVFSEETVPHIQKGIEFVVKRNPWIIEHYELEEKTKKEEGIPIVRGSLPPFKRGVYERFMGVFTQFQKFVEGKQAQKDALSE